MTATARTCRWCYSIVVDDAECQQCAKEHANHQHRGWFLGCGKKGRPTLDVQEGNRENYFGDHSE